SISGARPILKLKTETIVSCGGHWTFYSLQTNIRKNGIMVGKLLLYDLVVLHLKPGTTEDIVDLEDWQHLVMGNSPSLSFLLKGVLHAFSDKVHTIRHGGVIEIAGDDNGIVCSLDMIA